MKSISIIAAVLLFIANPSINAQSVQFKTSDGIKIAANYAFPERISDPIPAIILIHNGGSSKNAWKNLSIWEELTKAGFAVLAYDIRIHGQSGEDKGDIYDLFNNPKRAPLDLLAAIDFLKKDPRIDSDKIGIIGGSVGGNLACVAAASDAYQVKSVVSLSAKASAAQNLSGTKSPLAIENAFFIASEKEQNGLRKKWANQLYERTKGQKKIKIVPGDTHGSHILRDNDALVKEVIQWFNDTL